MLLVNINHWSSTEITMLLVSHEAQKLWCYWSNIKHRNCDVLGQTSSTKIIMVLVGHQAQKLRCHWSDIMHRNYNVIGHILSTGIVMLLVRHQAQKLWCYWSYIEHRNCDVVGHTSSTEIVMLHIGDNQSVQNYYVCYRTMKQTKSYWSVIKQRHQHTFVSHYSLKHKTTT